MLSASLCLKPTNTLTAKWFPSAFKLKHFLPLWVLWHRANMNSASEKEVMTVVSGALTVKLAGSDDWKTYKQGDSFVAVIDEPFQLKVAVDTAYLCTYG